MDKELIEVLEKEAGLGREQAENAARVVKTFLERRAAERGSAPNPEEFRGLFAGSAEIFEGKEKP